MTRPPPVDPPRLAEIGLQTIAVPLAYRWGPPQETFSPPNPSYSGVPLGFLEVGFLGEGFLAGKGGGRWVGPVGTRKDRDGVHQQPDGEDPPDERREEWDDSKET